MIFPAGKHGVHLHGGIPPLVFLDLSQGPSCLPLTLLAYRGMEVQAAQGIFQEVGRQATRLEALVPHLWQEWPQEEGPPGREDFLLSPQEIRYLEALPQVALLPMVLLLASMASHPLKKRMEAAHGLLPSILPHYQALLLEESLPPHLPGRKPLGTFPYWRPALGALSPAEARGFTEDLRSEGGLLLARAGDKTLWRAGEVHEAFLETFFGGRQASLLTSPLLKAFPWHHPPFLEWLDLTLREGSSAILASLLEASGHLTYHASVEEEAYCAHLPGYLEASLPSLGLRSQAVLQEKTWLGRQQREAVEDVLHHKSSLLAGALEDLLAGDPADPEDEAEYFRSFFTLFPSPVFTRRLEEDLLKVLSPEEVLTLYESLLKREEVLPWEKWETIVTLLKAAGPLPLEWVAPEVN